jgi:mRNA-degrading endonuclease RelE of RelBE toxin-antitoxin system
MAFEIEITAIAEEHLASIRAFDRRRIARAIDVKLPDEPTKETKSRKPLPNVSADFDFDPPLWELRVGEFRVFYDVDLDQSMIRVRAVRRKRASQTTEDVLHEEDDS